MMPIVHVLSVLILSLIVCHTTKAFTTSDHRSLYKLVSNTLIYILPANRTIFEELCFKKKMVCTSAAFAKKPGYFRWREGISDADKDRFWQSYKCITKQDLQLCPIDGEWSLWTTWSNCTASCMEAGRRNRTRECNNPRTANKGKTCSGQYVDVDNCQGQCNDNHTVSGLQEAEKYLQNIHKELPQLRHRCLDNHCSYSTVSKYLDVTRSDRYWSQLICFKHRRACPVDGSWAPWGRWSTCTGSCGFGYKYRQRHCASPKPLNGGQQCPGDAFEKERCIDKKCTYPADEKALFSDWSDFSPCSVSCDKYGIQTTQKVCLLTRNCHLNNNVVKSITIKRPCFQGACPKRGGWSEWSEMTDCSAKCGAGRRTRLRMCSNPFPSGGATCIGPDVEASDCVGKLCLSKYFASNPKQSKASKYATVPIGRGDPYSSVFDYSKERMYTSWSKWSACTSSCGGGYRTRIRECKRNQNAKTKIVCKGEIRNIQFCNIFVCPVNGKWGDWLAWSACGVTCGDGHRRRYRRCDNPLPKNGGTCVGDVEERSPCKGTPCKHPHRHYSSWADWTSCSATCGRGIQRRHRKYGAKTETVVALCNLQSCPVDGRWSHWGGWSHCNSKCGMGHHFRDRSCSDPAPADNGKLCQGPGTETINCFTRPCSRLETVVHFLGTSYLTYSAQVKPLRYLVLYLRFISKNLEGTLLYRHRTCKQHTWQCKHAIKLSLSNGRPELTVVISGIQQKVVCNDRIWTAEWTDIQVGVSSRAAYIRLNDGKHYTTSYKNIPNKYVDFDADMIVGAGEKFSNGFKGSMSIFRINFKDVSLYQSPYWLGPGIPDKQYLIFKFREGDVLNCADFREKHYAHLNIPDEDLLDIQMTVRLRRGEGLIMYNQGRIPGSFVSMALVRNSLILCFSCGGSTKDCTDAEYLKTREWYYISLRVEGQRGLLRVNRGSSTQLTCYGRNYHPTRHLYVAGAPARKWDVISRVIKVKKGLLGNVDMVHVNGQKFSFRRGAMFDSAGVLNSMGFSIAAHVTEVIQHIDSLVTLHCDYTMFSSGRHVAHAYWLYGDTVLNATSGMHVIPKAPGLRNVSVLELRPSLHYEGIYACVVNQDGRLIIAHAFPLIRDDVTFILQLNPEWTIIVAVVIVVLLVFIITITVCIFKRKSVSSIVAAHTSQSDVKDLLLDDVGEYPMDMIVATDTANLSGIREDGKDTGNDGDRAFYRVSDMENVRSTEHTQAAYLQHPVRGGSDELALRMIEDNKNMVLDLAGSHDSMEKLRAVSSRLLQRLSTASTNSVPSLRQSSQGSVPSRRVTSGTVPSILTQGGSNQRLPSSIGSMSSPALPQADGGQRVDGIMPFTSSTAANIVVPSMPSDPDLSGASMAPLPPIPDPSVQAIPNLSTPLLPNPSPLSPLPSSSGLPLPSSSGLPLPPSDGLPLPSSSGLPLPPSDGPLMPPPPSGDLNFSNFWSHDKGLRRRTSTQVGKLSLPGIVSEDDDDSSPPSSPTNNRSVSRRTSTFSRTSPRKLSPRKLSPSVYPSRDPEDSVPDLLEDSVSDLLEDSVSDLDSASDSACSTSYDWRASGVPRLPMSRTSTSPDKGHPSPT